jgi:23S rRNA (adenine2503-C2)-methyltransferase
MRGVFDAGADALGGWLAERGHPRYRRAQILNWIVAKRALDFGAMTDLPASLRSELAAEWSVSGSKVVRTSGDEDGTTKLLLEFGDGQTVECVLIPEGARRTVCISTQVGCGMGCVFCASGLAGVARNLSTAEIVGQFLHLQSLLPANERIGRVVVMGMGEPLANLDALLPALAFATDSKAGLGLSARSVTISTVGLPSKIRRLARHGRPYHLAVSLHAPNDEIRRRIVPSAENIPLNEILAAADDFRRVSRRQVTFEYVLLAGVNDQGRHARELAGLLRGRDALINLIPYNPVDGLPYAAPAPQASTAFASILRDAGFVVKIRKRKGARIDAACGQLRRVHGELVPLRTSKGQGA